MQTLLNFKDHKYIYQQILAKASIDVKIGIGEINYDFVPTIDQNEDDFDSGKPIFFKHEGQYVILRGRMKVIEDVKKRESELPPNTPLKASGIVISGRLISSPALKLCRYQDPDEVKAIEEANERLRQEQIQADRDAYKPRRFNDRQSDDKPRFRKDGDKPRYGSDKKDAGTLRPPRSSSPNRSNNRNS